MLNLQCTCEDFLYSERMVLPNSPHQTLLDKANYITGFMVTVLDQDKVNHVLNRYLDLSYPARSLLLRLEDFRSGPSFLFAEIWSFETLKNIILSDRDNIIEEMELDEDDIRLHEIINMSGDEFLTFYFGHQPTRQELLDYIYLMMDHEHNVLDIGQELPITMLMNGLFFAPGYQRKKGRVDRNENLHVDGNLDFLSNEDWQMLGLLHGLEDADHDTITKMILVEQNKNAEELLLKGYSQEVRGFSMTEMLIQEVL